MEKKKIIEAGRKEGTTFVHNGMNYIVITQYQKYEEDGKEKIQKENVGLNIGKCFDCKLDLTSNPGIVFGKKDNKPVYMRCPECGAIINYKERAYANE